MLSKARSRVRTLEFNSKVRASPLMTVARTVPLDGHEQEPTADGQGLGCEGPSLLLSCF